MLAQRTVGRARTVHGSSVRPCQLLQRHAKPFALSVHPGRATVAHALGLCGWAALGRPLGTATACVGL
jgi:hypothetical protein